MIGDALMRLGFCFLCANIVSVLLLHPGKETFVFCGAGAVCI
jgi:hypothetical protein